MTGLPLWLSWQRIHLQCRRPGFNPWVRKIPWRRERLPTPVFWSGEFHRLYSPCGCKELDMTEWLSLSLSLRLKSLLMMANRWGNKTVTDFIFLGFKITADGDCSHEIKRYLLFGRKAMMNLETSLCNKGPSSQSYDFSNSHIWMWELDYKQSWALKNWCFWTVVLEKTLKCPLDWMQWDQTFQS